MKKYWNLLILIPLLSVLSCLDDESAYSPQNKEDINVDDNFQIDTTNTDHEVPPGQLAPGVHLVTIKVLQPNSPDSIERRFKYYMPVTIDVSKPIYLVFDFHGSYTFKAGEKPADPISDIKDGHPLNKKAVKTNSIICYPAALPIYTSTDSAGTVNWLDNKNHLPFVDAMLKYFTEEIVSPRIDPNRIYSTGHSSGAIYSFYLAFHRSDKFAAITPRAGQMNIDNEGIMPLRAVPVRVFAGEKDSTVRHNAVISNVTAWAERIGGYFAADMQMDTASYEDYADVTIRYWHGGKTDYEIYSLAGIGHGISVNECIDDMWEFMENHTLDNVVENLFVTTSIKKINAQCGEPFTFNINCTEGASITMTDAPKGWNAKLEGKTVTLTAPKEKDYYGDIDRDGSIVFTATKGSQTITCEVEYQLAEPKLYFEIGDIYYNEAFEPIGVVFWVNKSNIKEAKIISLQEIKRQIGDFGATFSTPDMNDGAGNTAKCVAENIKSGLGLTAAKSALIWAAEYSYKGHNGWYLPAINEVIAIYNNRTVINKSLTAIKSTTLPTNGYYLSSTVELAGSTKKYYEFNFNTGQISYETSMYADASRATKIVTKP